MAITEKNNTNLQTDTGTNTDPQETAQATAPLITHQQTRAIPKDSIHLFGIGVFMIFLNFLSSVITIVGGKKLEDEGKTPMSLNECQATLQSYGDLNIATGVTSTMALFFSIMAVCLAVRYANKARREGSVGNDGRFISHTRSEARQQSDEETPLLQAPRRAYM